jgi:hypothetical protein
VPMLSFSQTVSTHLPSSIHRLSKPIQGVQTSVSPRAGSPSFALLIIGL